MFHASSVVLISIKNSNLLLHPQCKCGYASPTFSDIQLSFTKTNCNLVNKTKLG